MKTAIRSSTFCWTLVFLFVVIAPTQAFAAGALSGSSSVTIADGVLTPSGVAIPAGGSVLWTNRGTRQHEIVAQRSAFPAFRLAPGGARSVAFMQPGQYPYLLDGVVKGIILVIVRTGPIGTSGPYTGSSSSSDREGCGHPIIYPYDVRVAVHREATESGTTTTLSDWKASWVAPMSVEHCGTVTTVTIAHTAPVDTKLHGGQSDIRFTWTQGSCHFTVSRKFQAAMAIQDGISVSSDGQSNFDFLFEIEDRGGLSVATTDAKHQACDDKAQAAYHLMSLTTTVNGIDTMASDTNLVLFFVTPPTVSPVGAAILTALASGNGFNFDTGEQQIPQIHVRERATVSFSRLGK